MTNYFLRDLVDIKNGKDHKHLADGEIPVFGSGGVMRYADQFIYNDVSILLPRKGTLDNIQYVNKPFWTVDTLYYTIVNKEKAVPYYLYNYLKLLDLSALNSGTGVPSMTFGAYYDVEVKLPNLETQTKIAKVLSDLDAKIELNNKINAELEAMAKLIYDYWFVQFEFPVLNPDGTQSGDAGYKSSGGKMVWNKELKREVPEGWEVKTLFETCDVQYGFPFSTEYFNDICDGKPVIRIRDILNNTVSNYSSQSDIDPKYEIKKGDLLIGMDGNFHINYWAKNGCYLNQRVVKLSQTILPNIYLRYQIEPYIQLREKSVSRTTVGHLSDKDLKAIKILIPEKNILSKIKSLFGNSLDKIVLNRKEKEKLAELRDWLLPMLMNGQVRVN